MKINKEYLKQQYLKENQIDLTTVKTDLKKIKKVIKSNVFTCYPNRYQLYKNKKTGRLYLTVCTFNFDIVILGYSDKKILNDQMRELFPEYIFFLKKELLVDLIYFLEINQQFMVFLMKVILF